MPFEIKGAYRIVLDLIYMQSGDLPDDARYISGLLGCSVRKWTSIRKFLVDADKLIVTGDFLTNYRAITELETLAKLQDKQRQNRSGPNKNKGLSTPRSDHPEAEAEAEAVKELSKDSYKTHEVITPDKPKPKGTTNASRKSKIPFKATEPMPAEYRAYADEKGFANADGEFEDWVDWWTSEGLTKIDWLATWRGRVRKAIKRKGTNGFDKQADRKSTHQVAHSYGLRNSINLDRM